MALDLKEHFVKYEALVQMVDAVFDRVKKEYPKEIYQLCTFMMLSQINCDSGLEILSRLI